MRTESAGGHLLVAFRWYGAGWADGFQSSSRLGWLASVLECFAGQHLRYHFIAAVSLKPLSPYAPQGFSLPTIVTLSETMRCLTILTEIIKTMDAELPWWSVECF